MLPSSSQADAMRAMRSAQIEPARLVGAEQSALYLIEDNGSSSCENRSVWSISPGGSRIEGRCGGCTAVGRCAAQGVKANIVQVDMDSESEYSFSMSPCSASATPSSAESLCSSGMGGIRSEHGCGNGRIQEMEARADTGSEAEGAEGMMTMLCVPVFGFAAAGGPAPAATSSVECGANPVARVCIGVLQATGKLNGGAFDADDEQTLERYADQIAVELQDGNRQHKQTGERQHHRVVPAAEADSEDHSGPPDVRVKTLAARSTVQPKANADGTSTPCRRVQRGCDIVQGMTGYSKSPFAHECDSPSVPVKPLSMAEAIKSMNLPQPLRARTSSNSSQYAPLYRSPLAAVRARYNQQAENLRSAINARVAAATPAKMKVKAHSECYAEYSQISGDTRKACTSDAGNDIVGSIGADMEALD